MTITDKQALLAGAAHEYEIVNTHGLNDGDVVLFYGALFRLEAKKVWPMRTGDNPVMQAETVTFDGILIGADLGNIPAGYIENFNGRKGWKFQGNKLASWCKVG